MSDLISREAATEGFESVTWHDPRDTDIAHEVIGELPSVHPTQNNTFNTLKALDCISRQAALDAIIYEPYYVEMHPVNVINELREKIKTLPPAEPEIIRCKDCKYYNPDDRCYLQGAEADDFCSYAERREE